MSARRGSSFGQSLAVPTASTSDSRRPSQATEMIERNASVSTAPYFTQVHRRRNNHQAVIENPLAHLTDKELERDVLKFSQEFPSFNYEKLLRAARVAKDIRTYDEVARTENPDAYINLPVHLTLEEKSALVAEKDVLFSQRKMFPVILTVSLAAFLQGFVQSSINGASLYANQFGLSDVTSATPERRTRQPTGDDWRLGAANAAPYLFASFVGCWLSLPINDRIGRRGAMAVAACLIFASSLGAAWSTQWYHLFIARAFNGIGMGVKAVSTPILASETAVGFWRGSSILAWQLWVAFGIFTGFAFNLIFWTNENWALQLILAAPFVPALFLLTGLYFCPESPRYYLRSRSPKFSPSKAYEILLQLRSTDLQALRDVYLVYKSVQQEEHDEGLDIEQQGDAVYRGFFAHLKKYTTQYRNLFTQRRLRNALISSSIVSLAQQLCGINVFAFYSGPLFSGVLGSGDKLTPMVYSLGYGAVNFIFGLPAIRTIDTLGRRKWLVLTLPVMTIFMGAGALSSLIPDPVTRGGITGLFVFLFAAAYSPGMGPVPFTLASESFPLSHREAGCAFAIATNFLFAGLLSILFPSIYAALGNGGSLGLFSGLNFVAFVLVFLLVEETKRRSLEDLDLVFAVRKRQFMKHQVTKYLPWFWRRYILRSFRILAGGRRRGGAAGEQQFEQQDERPSLYTDLVWGKPRRQPGASGYGDSGSPWVGKHPERETGDGSGSERGAASHDEVDSLYQPEHDDEAAGRTSEDTVITAHE